MNPQQLEAKRLSYIAELEKDGQLDPNCPTCVQNLYPFYRNIWKLGMFGPHVPPHKPSKRCESGGRPHCTCDTCF